jgi:hypothetical protein
MKLRKIDWERRKLEDLIFVSRDARRQLTEAL